MNTQTKNIGNTKTLKVCRGFTLIEMVVVTAVMALLAGTVIANLREGSRARNLKVASDAVQSSLRQAQGDILSGKQYPLGGSSAIFGLEVHNNVTSFQTFAERSDGTGKISQESIGFSSDVTATNIIVGGIGATKLEVRFVPPFGKILITGEGTSYDRAANVVATFMLRYKNAALGQKTVTVDGISGRIDIQ